jgi:hypothetical protein
MLTYIAEALEFAAKEGARRFLCAATAQKSDKQMTLTRFSKNLNLPNNGDFVLAQRKKIIWRGEYGARELRRSQAAHARIDRPRA